MRKLDQHDDRYFLTPDATPINDEAESRNRIALEELCCGLICISLFKILTTDHLIQDQTTHRCNGLNEKEQELNKQLWDDQSFATTVRS
jgi:hypothetical protein